MSKMNNKNTGRKGTIKKVFGLLKDYKILLICSLVMSVITVAMTLYAPIISGRAIDCIAAKGDVDINGVVSLIIRFIVIIIVAAISQWIMSTINNHIVYKIVSDRRRAKA